MARNVPINYPDDRFVAYSFFQGYILDGAIDQLQQQPFFVSFGMRTLGLVPRQMLSCGWPIPTIGTFEPFGPQSKVDRMTQNGQMTQADRSVVTDTLGKLTTTLPTGSAV